MSKESKKWIGGITLAIFTTSLLYGLFFYRPIKGRSLDQTGSHWVVEEGVYDFPEGLYVPPEKSLTIKPGATLRFGAGTVLAMHGSLEAVGTSHKKIVFTGLNGYWRGVRVMGKETYHQNATEMRLDWPNSLLSREFGLLLENLEKKSTFRIEHATIREVSVPGTTENPRLNYIGALEILGATAMVSKVDFYNIPKIGAIRVFNSLVKIRGISVRGDGTRKGIHLNNSIGVVLENSLEVRQEAKVCRDAFWILSSIVLAKDNVVRGFGDDGFDLKTSNAVIWKNKILENRDEGIDVDHDSSAIIFDNIVQGSENGIQISGHSEALIVGGEVSNARTGIHLRGQSLYSERSCRFTNNKDNFRHTDSEARAVEDSGWNSNGEMQGLLIEKGSSNLNRVGDIDEIIYRLEKSIYHE